MPIGPAPFAQCLTCGRDRRDGCIVLCANLESGTLDEVKAKGVTIAIANEPPYMQMNPDGKPGGWGQEMDAAILRVGLEKVSTISISCKASGEHADVGDGDPRFC